MQAGAWRTRGQARGLGAADWLARKDKGDSRDHDQARIPAQAQRATAAGPWQLAGRSGIFARGLYREGIGQWRRYRDQLAPVLPILAPWVAEFGYSVA